MHVPDSKKSKASKDCVPLRKHHPRQKHKGTKTHSCYRAFLAAAN